MVSPQLLWKLQTWSFYKKRLKYLLFLSSIPCNSSLTMWDPVLIKRSASVREKLSYSGLPSVDELYYPSAYKKSGNESCLRGFCNWIIPGKVMLGQYPGQCPELSGPGEEDIALHIESLVKDAGINLFCSLQSEIPPQKDQELWLPGGVYLSNPQDRKQFPNAFTRYAPIAEKFTTDCQFLHAPVEDLSVPNSNSLQDLLLTLVTHMKKNEGNIYIHCWGGRGRAGIVGSCLLSLLFPEADDTMILDLVQAGYDTRLGAKEMALPLSRSPQTETQRKFVRAFVQERRRQHSKK